MKFTSLKFNEGICRGEKNQLDAKAGFKYKFIKNNENKIMRIKKFLKNEVER